jgi:hypothetical protein
MCRVGRGFWGKALTHQRRLRNESLQRGTQAIFRIHGKLEKVSSFEEILKAIQEITDKINGLGKFYTYDTALRISAKLGHKPEHVYLHAGTRVGAKHWDSQRIAVTSQWRNCLRSLESLKRTK